jgi:hypothetical protein
MPPEERPKTSASKPPTSTVTYPIVFPAEAQLKACGQCGAELLCGPQEPYGNCWCDNLPNIMPVLPTSDTCLCRTCIDQSIQQWKQQQQNQTTTNSTPD